MEKLSKAQRLNQLRGILVKMFLLRVTKENHNRMIYKIVSDINKIANDPVNKNPDAVLEVYNHSVLRTMDKANKEDKLKKFAISFALRMNKRERDYVLSELEKLAIVEEAEKLARDKE